MSTDLGLSLEARAARDLAIVQDWGDGDTFGQIADRHGLTNDEVRRIILAAQLERKTTAAADVASVDDGTAEGGEPVEGAVVTGELVALGAAHLPIRLRGDGPPPNAPQDVIDNWLPDSARRLVLRGKSEHTLRAYLRAFGWWVRFAEQHHITTMPAPQNAMIRMLDAWELLPVHVKCAGGRQADGTPCGGHRPSPSAVWIWYSAMKWFHGIGEPPLPWEGGVKLADAIAGYTKQIKDDGWRASKAPRAFPHEIRAMVDAVRAAPDTVLAPARRDMIAALVLVGYLTGGRASDLARYRLSDIEYFPGGIQLTLARSKATKGDKNEEYRVIHQGLDRADYDPAYDGVLGLEKWMEQQRAQGITQGAIFRPVHKSGQIVRGGPDSLSYAMDVTALTRCVRKAAMLAWLASGGEVDGEGKVVKQGRLLQKWPDVTFHTLRRSRLQALLASGVTLWDAETLLGWAHGGAAKEYMAEIERQDPKAAGAQALL